MFEVIDIFPGSLDSSWCFIIPSVSHDVLCIKLSKQVIIYSLDVLLSPIWNQSVVPCPVLTVAS